MQLSYAETIQKQCCTVRAATLTLHILVYSQAKSEAFFVIAEWKTEFVQLLKKKCQSFIHLLIRACTGALHYASSVIYVQQLSVSLLPHITSQNFVLSNVNETTVPNLIQVLYTYLNSILGDNFSKPRETIKQ